MPPRTASKRSATRGRTQPRLYTPPLRRLTRRTTRGFEVADFAALIGEPLLPWQDWLVKHALELNPDGTFRFRVIVVLVARQNGKSSVKRTVSLWRMYIDGARHILGLAQDVALAREQLMLCQETVHSSPDLEAEWGGARNVNGENEFWIGAPDVVTSNSRYMIRAMNRKAGRGYPLDEVNIDELREQRSWDAWAAVSKTTMARPRAQIWAMSNAGDDESVVLNQLRDAALAGHDPSIFIAEWSAPDGCDLDDIQAWRQANPALGYLISEQAIRTALATDPPEVFRTEVLCQRVESLDSAIDFSAWQSCSDPTGTLTSARDRVVACVDVALDGHHVTLAAAATLDDGRVRVEIVDAWDSTEHARRKLPAIIDKVRPRLTAWFPSGPAAAIADVMLGLDAHELKGADVLQACQGMADMVTARQIVHPGDPLLNAHTAGAQKLHQGDGWRFTRRGAGHVDAAYAAAGAVHAALTVPYKPKLRPLIVVGRRSA